MSKSYRVEISNGEGTLASEVVEAKDSEAARKEVVDRFKKNNENTSNLRVEVTEYEGEPANEPDTEQGTEEPAPTNKQAAV